MNIWIKRSFILLSVGGGFSGVVFCVTLLSQIKGQIAAYVLVAAMIAAFGFGVFCGLRLIENEVQGLRLLRWFFALQAPIISSPVFAYHFSSGAAVNLSWIDTNVSIFWRIGSEMGVWILQDRPWGLGVNALALLLCVWTNQLLKSPAATSAPAA